jgi:hypothetical protein
MLFKITALFLLLFNFSAWADSLLIYQAQKKGINLTEKDRDTIEIGEISNASYIVGGILGTYPIGFGIGHAIQGRWYEQGQIFTWGELGSLAVAVSGAVGCINESTDGDDKWGCSDLESGLMIAGVAGYIGFRIWEIVDVWVAPLGHNSKFRSLQKYINTTKSRDEIKSSLDLVPLYSPKMGQGLGLKFVF